MSSTKRVPIKYAQGCIAVKEYFREYTTYGIDYDMVKIIFCIDADYMPCKLCIFKSNILTPVNTLVNFDIDKLLRSKKAMYSRLDCVVLVAEFTGAYNVNKVTGMFELAEYDLQLYRPFGVYNEELTVTNIESEVHAQVLEELKMNIVNTIAPYALTKKSFYSER